MSPDHIVQSWNETRNKAKFKKLLLDAGFKIIGCGQQSLVFSEDSLDFVVKVSQGVVTRKLNKQLDKFRLGYLYVNGNRQIAIQSKVNRPTKASRYRAWRKIRDSVNVDIAAYDIHQDNVGWHNRKPVFFDYL